MSSITGTVTVPTVPLSTSSSITGSVTIPIVPPSSSSSITGSVTIEARSAASTTTTTPPTLATYAPAAPAKCSTIFPGLDCHTQWTTWWMYITLFILAILTFILFLAIIDANCFKRGRAARRQRRQMNMDRNAVEEPVERENVYSHLETARPIAEVPPAYQSGAEKVGYGDADRV